MITHQDVYRCYSVNLQQFMTKHNVQYFLIAIDAVTRRTFWAYEKTERFNNLLQEWINSNPKNKK